MNEKLYIYDEDGKLVEARLHRETEKTYVLHKRNPAFGPNFILRKSKTLAHTTIAGALAKFTASKESK